MPIIVDPPPADLLAVKWTVDGKNVWAGPVLVATARSVRVANRVAQDHNVMLAARIL